MVDSSLSLSIYGFDLIDTRINSCYLNEIHTENRSQRYGTIEYADNKFIACTVFADNKVNNEHIVTHHWVLNYLELKRKEVVKWYPLIVSIPAVPICINLRFHAFKSLKHWDEIGDQETLYIPKIWYPTWHNGVKKELVQKYCKIAYTGTVLCKNAMIALKYLDCIMLFQVKINQEDLREEQNEKYAILGSPQCSYTIHIEEEEEVDMMQNSVLHAQLNSKLKKPLCFDTTMQNVLTIGDGIFHCPNSPSTTDPALSRSVIISSPSGGGKTQLLHSLCDHYRTLRADGVNIDVIYVSCSVISRLNKAKTMITTETETTAAPAEIASINTEDKIMSYLDHLLALLGIEKKKKTVTSERPATLLALDDLDYILDQYAINRDEIPSTNDPAVDSYRIFGYCLSMLLAALRDVTVRSKLLVLGTTHRGASQLLRAHTGCPEFEKCWELPNPMITERASILQWMLQDTQLNLENITPDSEGASMDTVRTCWAERLAGLTAGFLPGDLHAVAQRITLIHRGEQVAAATATNASRTETNPATMTAETVVEKRTGDVVSWHCALEAVVSTTPKQLQQLSANSSMKGGERLSWKDFAGYHHIITDLQRRLATVQENQCIHKRSTQSIERIDRGIGNDKKKILQAASLRGVVIHGPTGCGKTLLASVIASEMKMNFVSIRSTDLLSKYFGETESTIRDLFHRARAAAPCVLFFDDFDSLAHKRSKGASEGGGETSNGLHGRILSTFLNELDGIMSATTSTSSGGSQPVLVIAACQDVANLDEALVRPGRLQHHVLLHTPGLDDLHAIVCTYFAKLNCAPDLSLERVTATLHALQASASEAESFVRTAFSTALREAIYAIETEMAAECSEERKRELQTQTRQITQRHVDAALEDLLRRNDLVEIDDEEEGVGNTTTNDYMDSSSAANPIGSAGSSASFTWAGGFSAGV